MLKCDKLGMVPQAQVKAAAAVLKSKLQATAF